MYDYRTSNGAANNGGTNRRHGLVDAFNGLASLVSGAYQIFAPVLTDIMDRARSASENITQSLNGILETYRIDRTVDVAYLKGYRKKKRFSNYHRPGKSTSGKCTDFSER